MPHIPPQKLIRPDVSNGSNSEVELADADFRFTPQSRHPAGGQGCPFSANSGLILAPVVDGRRRRRRPKHNTQIDRGRLSEAETQSDRGIDVAVLEEAAGQPAVHLVDLRAKRETP